MTTENIEERLNPRERSREFRDKLKHKNPELAERYEHFLYAKSRCYTASYAHELLKSEETQKYIRTEIGPTEFENGPRIIYGLWVGHQKSQKMSIPFQPLNTLKIQSIDDIIKVYKQFQDTESNTKQKFTSQALNFLEFLKEKVLKLTTHTPTRKYIQNHNPFELFRIACPIDTEIINNLAPKGIQFYTDQYRRLEREQQVGTTQSEKIFLPLLQAVANDMDSLSKDISDKISSYIITGIITNIKPEITLTIDEMIEAIQSSPDENFDEFMGDFACEKWKVISDLEHMRKEIEQERSAIPEEDAQQYGQFPVEREQLINFFTTTHFEYPQDTAENLWYAISHNYGMTSPEGRLKFTERKLRESEKVLETMARDEFGYWDDEETEDIKKDTKETALRNRMTLELLRIYRRNKQEIDGIIKPKSEDTREEDEY